MSASQSVAVVFTDLVGSTALSSRVGPERTEELRIEHFALLRAALTAHGGREIKNLGDGLMVVFASASSALSAGVAMQQAFEARNRRADEALEIRVAVSAGEADEEDGDFFGPPVVEAARLCGICGGGQLLTSALVKMFVGARGGFEFEALGARELKGLDEPVDVFAVRWEPITDAEHADFEVPLPARLTPAPRSVFVGRSVESARFDDAWKNVGAAQRRVWLLGGEAGIGKTMLVTQLASRVHADGAVVLYGRCNEDLGVPYQPWIEALTTLVAHAPDDLIDDHVAARGGELARLVPALSERAGVAATVASDAEAERYALFGATTDLLSRAATRLPVILVLDDLHGADKPTVQLLRHVAGVVEPTRLMVVATYRPSDIDAGHPLTDAFASLRREVGVEFVDLSGLDDVELLELMEVTAGHELPEEGIALRDAIAAETNGNPFFATEILFHLAESGAIKRQDGRWVAMTDIAAHGLPVSVRHVVGDRVARLGPEAEKLLRVAAVIGRDFDLGLLAEVADVDEDDALDILDVAVTALLVNNVGPDRYSFAHALVEHTLYEDLTPSRRGRAHRRIAQALEVRCGAEPGERIGELAHHWSAAMVPDDASKAIEYARRAGDRALAQLAPDEALRWYGQALEHYDRHGNDPRLHTRLMIGLGDAQRQVGEPAYRETLLNAARAARSLADTDLLVAAALANHRGWASVVGAVDDEKVAVLEAALVAVGPTDSLERARVLATLVAELSFDADLPRRRAFAEEAVGIARRLNAPRALVAALIGLLTLPDRADDEPLRWADEAIEVAGRLDDSVSLAIASASAATSASSFGDRARFDRYVACCTEAATRVGQSNLVWRAIGVRAVEAFVNGDLRGAESLADEVLALEVEGGSNVLWNASLIVALRIQQGRAADVRDLLASIAADERRGSGYDLARAGVLFTAVLTDDLEFARVSFEEHATQGFTASDDQTWLTYVCGMAFACARLADRERAPRLLELLEPFGHLIVTTGAVSLFSVSQCEGMLAALLGRDDDADRRFADAIELTASFGYPFLIATAQLEWARALFERSPADPERAQPLLSEALATARRFGFGGVERDALELQARTA